MGIESCLYPLVAEYISTFAVPRTADWTTVDVIIKQNTRNHIFERGPGENLLEGTSLTIADVVAIGMGSGGGNAGIGMTTIGFRGPVRSPYAVTNLRNPCVLTPV